jgi:hypothetical protein
MKWSRLVYCAATAALTTFLVMRGASAWLTVPLGAFAAWWTFQCARALWIVLSFHVAGWRLHLITPVSVEDNFTEHRKVKRWVWLANPKLDGWVDAATVVGVLMFPTLLWLPLILWLLGEGIR